MVGIIYLVFTLLYANKMHRIKTFTVLINCFNSIMMCMCILSNNTKLYPSKSFRVLQNDIIISTTVSDLKLQSTNPCWNPELYDKSWNLQWNDSEIQKSILKYWNPTWNSVNNSEIQKSNLKSWNFRNPNSNPEIQVKSSAFRSHAYPNSLCQPLDVPRVVIHLFSYILQRQESWLFIWSMTIEAMSAWECTLLLKYAGTRDSSVLYCMMSKITIHSAI